MKFEDSSSKLQTFIITFKDLRKIITLVDSFKKVLDSGLTLQNNDKS